MICMDQEEEDINNLLYTLQMVLLCILYFKTVHTYIDMDIYVCAYIYMYIYIT